MNRMFRFSLVAIAGLLLVVFACKRADVEYIGPAYVSAPEGFGVISFNASTASVDLSSGTVSFDATFSNPVSWTLTITGQTSGAVSIFKGTSGNFSNIIWKGNQDGVAFFRTGETAMATLSFFGTSLTSSAPPITIINVPDFRTCGQFPQNGDFENLPKPSLGPPIFYTPGWAHFNFPDPIPNVEQGVDSMAIDYNGKLVPSVQGKKYYFIKGKGDQPVFVSGLQYFGPLSPVLPNDPDNVWINMYIYGTGDPNAAVELEYQEDDATESTASGYQGDDDDAFVAHFDLTHKGWKLFSVQYSKLYPSLNLLYGGSGNKIHEPHRLKSFDLVLLKKSIPDSPVEVYFDYPIITVGGPFKPCN